MAITRTFQWLRGATTDIAGASVITTAPSYATVAADVGNYLFVKETATNAKGSATTNYPPFGPITAVGQTYVPAAGRIEPLYGNQHNVPHASGAAGRPLPPRYLGRSEVAVYDAEVASENLLHSLMHDAQPSTTAVASGAWSSAATWDNGVPVAGMTVHIGSAFNVLYDVESDAQLKYVVVHGTLRWDVSKDTRIVCDMIHSAPGSYIQIGTKLNPVPHSSANGGKARVRIDFIGAIPGTLANNPGQTVSGSNLTLGMMTMGKVDIFGTEMVEKVDIDSIASAGATQAVVKAGFNISNWRVGDWVVVPSRNYSGFGPDPEYAGPSEYWLVPGADNGSFRGSDSNGFKKSQCELRQITAINQGTRTVTFDQALEFSHPTRTTQRTVPKATHALAQSAGITQGQTVTIPARMVNMSRSIEFSSVGALRKGDGKINHLTRAHLMFMACDQLDLRWFGTKNMARTEVDPTLWITEPAPFTHPASSHLNYYNNRLFYDQANTQPMGNPNNVRGRYAVHIHGTGAYGEGARLSRNLVRLVGASCWATRGAPPQPGWVITHHAANAAIERCAVFHYRGAGIVTETGNETGQWIDNTVMFGLGDGFPNNYSTRQTLTPNHNGHQGTAYENQARHIVQRGNEAASTRFCFMFSAQGADPRQGLVRGPDALSLRLTNPIAGPTFMLTDRDSYGEAQSQVTDLHTVVACDADHVFWTAHRVNIMRQDNTPFIAIGWRCYGCNRVMHIDNYSYNYFFKDFAWFGGNGGVPTTAGTRSAQFGWRNGVIEGYGGWFDGQKNNGPGFIDINTNMTHAPELNKYPLQDSANMPNVTPRFEIRQDGLELNFYGDNATFQSQPAALFRGTFFDGFSPSGRQWPFWQEGEAPEDGSGFNTMTVSETAGSPAWGLVERNGCYQVNGQWKMPSWFGTVDWKTFDAFFFKIDFNLVNFPADFLAANTVTPVAPIHPLPPEDINKPFPVIAAPSNIEAPFIAGMRIVGKTMDCVWGKWSGKPNDVDWFDFTWQRNGATVGSGRLYTVQAADVGQSVTCVVRAYNSGGSTSVTTAAVIPKAAYTGPTPDAIFGGSMRDEWEPDEQDGLWDSYNPGGTYMPGTQMGSEGILMGWAGQKTLISLGQYSSNATEIRNGWGSDRTRCFSFSAIRGHGNFGEHHASLGSGSQPLHVFIAVQRNQKTQTQNEAVIIRAGGHRTHMGTDAAQNAISNTAVGNTLTTFPKGSRAVIYHGRDSTGSRWGFNEQRFQNANGPITNGDRDMSIGDKSAYLDWRKVWWIDKDNISAQEYADMVAFIRYHYVD